MSNYDMDEIERTKSQKKRWSNNPQEELGFGRDDQNNIKNILKLGPSKPCQQWDAQTQSYVTVVKDHIEAENEKMTLDPVGYELYNAPENILPPGQKDRPRLEKEEVTNPKHYDKVGFGIQPLEYITANELDFLEGNVIKYVSRYPHKGGLNDLLKARTYIEKLIERERIKDE